MTVSIAPFIIAANPSTRYMFAGLPPKQPKDKSKVVAAIIAVLVVVVAVGCAVASFA